MNIVQIVSGSGGGFYCQNCVRDVALARALHQAGHTLLFVPLYLPFQEMMGAAGGPIPAPVFYGAVNVYLAQQSALFRRLPEALRRVLDAPGLLRWAAGRAGTTRADGLGDLTLSVLEGREGRQRRELDQLCAWLATQPRPDVLHISNALLLGLAPALRETLGTPVVCTLQDEDTWLDALPPRYRERCWQRIRALCREVDRLIPVSADYAARMQDRLDLAPSQCRVIPPGVDTAMFSPAAAPPDVPTLGFLAEIIPEYGPDLLFEAFVRLKRRSGLEALQLKITGTDPARRTPFVRRLRRRIEASGFARDVQFSDAYRDAGRVAFLRSLSVLCVPARRSEAFGLFLIEAMACGVPVVQPALGAYPEVIEAAGGGRVYAPDAGPQQLADVLDPLLRDALLRARLGMQGRAGVTQHFALSKTAAALVETYRALKL